MTGITHIFIEGLQGLQVNDGVVQVEDGLRDRGAERFQGAAVSLLFQQVDNITETLV